MKFKTLLLAGLFSTLATAATNQTASLHYTCSDGPDMDNSRGFQIKIKKVTRTAKAYYTITSVKWFSPDYEEGSLYNFSTKEYLANIGSIGATSYSGRTVYVINFDHMSEVIGEKFKSLVSGYDIETKDAWGGVYSCALN